ncbi:uncharacterized protein LOC126896025 [Daktulosphaira vitifoliae]|uniref:uncharacterized protein LOC126896025 n=1 Tax=Daktulosphaira vitifoliae TaxID=58002 RepID=UPI0021A9EEB7|nr:uncharacterized protein LOC126896025 [Daktulosphaira vitifoliae]
MDYKIYFLFVIFTIPALCVQSNVRILDTEESTVENNIQIIKELVQRRNEEASKENNKVVHLIKDSKIIKMVKYIEILFKKIDLYQKSKITLQMTLNYLESAGLQKNLVEKYFEPNKYQGNDLFDLTKFTYIMVNGYLTHVYEIRKAFQKYDENLSGFISVVNMNIVLKEIGLPDSETLTINEVLKDKKNVEYDDIINYITT